MYRALVLVALALAACATPIPASSPMPTGGDVAPPVGWVSYCAHNPDDPSC